MQARPSQRPLGSARPAPVLVAPPAGGLGRRMGELAPTLEELKMEDSDDDFKYEEVEVMR